jgi:ectoine hydroxylase-related dioxygenase (phytanoyl-CoA dioxygenase family)
MEHTTSQQLAELDAKGYVVIEGGLDPGEVEKCRVALNLARENEWQEGLNAVGNMWFDSLLVRMPEVFGPLVAHPSVRPHLTALLGSQCQLRSLRGHINPGAYLQEWHMDFYGYWKQDLSAKCAVRGTGVNTTFYFQDNGPGIAHLRFISNGHRIQPPESVVNQRGRSISEAAFNEWANSLDHDVIYPKAGDVVLFYSHIPHRGAKENAALERSNIVCHYQNNPFYAGVAHVSEPIGTPGIFPLS